jgi:hypothetical protein
MIPVSDALKELLCRHGMSAGSLGGDDTQGMIGQPVGAGAASVKGPDPKARPVYREVSEPNPAGEKPRGFAFQVHVNPDVPNASTRKRTTQVPFLVVV